MNEQVYMPVIGIDNLHYGKVISDSTSGITGEEPKVIPGMTEAGYNRNGNVNTFFADNVSYCTATGSGEIDGAFAVADVPPNLSSELYGDQYDEETGELLMGDIDSPDVFIQYRIQKSNGSWRYVTIYKIKCVPNASNVTTKGGQINFQTNGFSFKAANTIYNGKFCRILDDDDPNLPEGVTPEVIAENWFTDINWKISATA